MAQDIVGSLFGMQQQPDYSAQDYRNAIAMAELGKGGMGRFVGGMLGSQLGRTAGQAIGSLFGVNDPRMQQASVIKEAQQQGFDVTSTEGLKQLAQFFVQRGQPGLASQVAMQAQTMSRSAAEEQYKLAQAEAALREKKGTPQSQAEQVLLNQLQAQYGEVGGAQRFYQMQEASKRNVAAAGAAQYGGEKIANLSGAQNIVEGYTKKPMERLQAIGEAQTYLGQAGTNPAAVPQLRRALVKLGGGDSQVAQREVQQIAGSMGIAGNVSEAVNQFFTGKPTAEQLKLIGQVVQGAENYYANQYNKGRQQAETVLGAAKLDPQTRAALLPKEYKLPEQKTYPNAPKTGTVQGGYRFKGGNPADPKNWEKI